MAIIVRTHAQHLAKMDVRATAKAAVKTPARPDAKTLLSAAHHRRAEAVAAVEAIAVEIAAIAEEIAVIVADTVADVRDARRNAHRRAPAPAPVTATARAARLVRRRALVHARVVARVLAHRCAQEAVRLHVLAIQDNHLWTLQRKKPPFGMRA